MMTDTRQSLLDQVKGTAMDLNRLVGLVNGTEDSGDGDIVDLVNWLNERGADIDEDDDSPDFEETARQILDEWPLEIVEHGTRQPGGEWEFTHSLVVFSTGGPHIELDTSDGRVVGYWGSDTVWTGVDSSVVEYFEAIAGL